jgi:hypothetical protein
MYVNKRKILISSLGTGSTINISLGTNFFPVDNAELIQTKFVNDEVDNSINPIIDYKKLIFKPSYIDDFGEWKYISKFKINLNFYTPQSISNGSPEHRGSNPPPPNYEVPGVYSDLNFTFDDLFCKTNRFINSFFRMSFFNSPVSGENELLFFSDVYTQIGDDQKNSVGFPLNNTQSPISFILGDPVLEPEEIHEGFYIYWFKDLVDNAPNKEYDVYMVLQFNNALNGKIYQMGASKDFSLDNIQLDSLNGENGILYLKVRLKNDNGEYKYTFLPNEKQSPQPGSLKPPGVNLSPSDGSIPRLTFWQITP